MKFRISYLLFLLGCVLLIILAVQLVFPGSVTIHEQRGESTVTFSVDRSTVFAPGDCIAVMWNAENISEIYFNEIPTTGVNGERFCMNADTFPTLRVVYPNNTAVQEFTIPIMFFVDRVELWIVMIGAVAAWIFGAALLVFQRRAASDDATHMPRRISVFGVIGVIIVVTAGLYLAGELMLRLYFSAFGSEDQRISYVYSREEVNRALPLNIALPTVGYGLSPFNPTVNSLGYRGEDITIPKPEGVYRIVALGGSATFGFVPTEYTYPAQLQQILREEYGYTNVEVVNAGVSGYNTFDIMANFITRVLELEPDLILYYEAMNDMGSRIVDPDCYQGVNALRGLDPRGVVATDSTNSPLSPSVLYRFITIQLGLMPDPHEGVVFVGTVIPCGSGEARTEGENVASNPPVYYRRNLTSIIGVAQVNQIEVLFSTWAYHESSDEPTDYWRAAMVEHNQIVTDLADQFGLLYVDYAALAAQDDSAWSDDFHMGVEGLRHQAETYAAYLVENGIIPRP